MSDHRRVRFPHAKAPPHHCVWCGLRIYVGRKDRRWHDGRGDDVKEPNCLGEYRIATDRYAAARALAKAGVAMVCAECGYTPREDMTARMAPAYFDLDHIVPLADGGTFGIENLQLLCTVCHKLKTKREAGERAARKRSARVEEFTQLHLGVSA